MNIPFISFYFCNSMRSVLYHSILWQYYWGRGNSYRKFMVILWTYTLIQTYVYSLWVNVLSSYIPKLIFEQRYDLKNECKQSQCDAYNDKNEINQRVFILLGVVAAIVYSNAIYMVFKTSPTHFIAP